MNDLAIKIRNVGKKYKLGIDFRVQKRALRYRTIGDAIAQSVKGLLSMNENSGRARPDFWALHDVSFDINPGEAVGIIGRNGAGKSTLLKIISRITAPTTGRIEIRGRVASLLEVGTGFHMELTGRENVFLNGAILGMSKKEIQQKFDEIVAFSEIEQYIDTPVKRYSSGMAVRLAFAVAAHLQPEILIIDEVLAVGDSSFQKKCLGKMEEAGKTGRTVLFVSHNMHTILRLCNRVILLNKGGVVADGSPQTVVKNYLEADLGAAGMRHWNSPSEAPGDDTVRLKSVSVLNGSSQSGDDFAINEPVCVEIQYWILREGARLSPNIRVTNEEGTVVFASFDQSDYQARSQSVRELGLYRSVCWIPGNFLSEGRFVVMAAVSSLTPVLKIHIKELDVVAFYIRDVDSLDTARGVLGGTIPGAVRPLLRWDTSLLDPMSLTSKI